MFIQLKTDVLVRCSDGSWYTVPKNSPVNYGSKRDGSSMVHYFHAPIKRVHNRIVHHETVTHTVVTPVSDRPDWL